MEVLSVGDRMQMSVEFIEMREEDQLAPRVVTVRVKEIRRDANGLVTLMLERAPEQVRF